jgi:hypothetical protein
VGGLKQRVGAVEIVGALVLCAALLYVMAHSGMAADRTTASVPHLPAPPTVTVPAPPVVSSVRLHSRFVGTDRLELWGAAPAPDGTTVRLSIKASGIADRPLASAPVSKGHFYATAWVPKSLRGRRITIGAMLAG